MTRRARPRACIAALRTTSSSVLIATSGSRQQGPRGLAAFADQAVAERSVGTVGKPSTEHFAWNGLFADTANSAV